MKQFLSFRKLAVPAVALALLLSGGAATPLRADGCDDIGSLGDRWRRLSDYIGTHSDDGKLRKAEAAKVQQTAHELLPPTKAFADVLVKDFSSKKADEARPKSLGKQLQASIEELAALKDDDDWDDVAAIVGHIGETLDKVADICSK